MTGIIFGIKRGEIHDGDGIRTTVFFKGCPLRCIWCHNPEGLSPRRESAFFAEKCVSCGACRLQDKHAATPSDCLRCPAEALVSFGEEWDADSLADELAKDAPFFRASGGGVTLSGGECLWQGGFALCLMRALASRGISVNVDTCGCVGQDVLDAAAACADTFLYDIKAIDPLLHKRLTGRDNALILENLRHLVARGARIEVRIPLVVGYNDGEIPAIAGFLASLGGIRRVKVLRYHDFAASRYAALGMPCTLPNAVTTRADAEAAVAALASFGIHAVC